MSPRLTLGTSFDKLDERRSGLNYWKLPVRAEALETRVPFFNNLRA